MNRIFTSAVACAVMGGAVLMTGSAVAQQMDRSVCYKVILDKADTYDRLYLDIKRHSPLGTGEIAYSVHGKYVDAEQANGGNWKSSANMNTATGTVVTRSPGNNGYMGQTGARLGVETAAGLYMKDRNKTENKTFDCTNSQTQAAPDSWYKCAVDGEPNYTLERADQNDEYCDFFQDGENNITY